ncbi:hypothetical protein ABT340_34315 [Streptosporangium sp. NPDC000239]|uniref:hypothetical protein n=1 Tax=Streptosporangium sp. NPDC000239 TaxID=3154248 RepID=UPI003323DA45
MKRIGVVLSAAVLVAGLAPAGADASTTGTTVSTTGAAVTSPDAPEAAGATGGQARRPAAPPATSALLANPPTVSPSAGYAEYDPGTTITCPSGNLCPEAWNPVTNKWRQFRLYTCARYSLSYWKGEGFYTNNQTGGVTSYFYGQAGEVLHSFTPDSGVHDYNWEPVWSIRNC